MPAAPAVETITREGEEPVKLPPTVQINKLSDKFREALARGDAKPAEKPTEKPPEKATEKPAEKQAEKPPLTTRNQSAEKPGDTKEPKIPREHFKALETQRDEFKTKWEAAEERARQNEAKAKDVEAKIPADYEEIKGKLSKHEEFMQKFYVEQSPQFQAAFDQKIAAGIDEIKETAGREKGDELAELLSLPRSAKREEAIAALTEDMSSFQRDIITQATREVRKLQKERAAELAKGPENFKNLQNVNAQRATQEKLARQEALERSYKVAMAEAAKQTVHFQRIDGNQEHNERVAESEKMLKEFTTSDLSPQDHASLSVWAVRGIRGAETDRIRDALISKLQNELKAIQDAVPSLEGGGKGGAKAEKKSVAQKFKDALEHGIPES